MRAVVLVRGSQGFEGELFEKDNSVRRSWIKIGSHQFDIDIEFGVKPILCAS
jgi:hypothetical protein